MNDETLSYTAVATPNATTFLLVVHQRLDEAVARVVGFLERILNDDNDESAAFAVDEMCGKQASTIVRLVTRQEFLYAWHDLQRLDHGNERFQLNPEQLQVLFVDLVVDAFADLRERRREEMASSPDVSDLDRIVECLQSGMDLLSENRSEESQEDLRMLFFDFNNDGRIHGSSSRASSFSSTGNLRASVLEEPFPGY